MFQENEVLKVQCKQLQLNLKQAKDIPDPSSSQSSNVSGIVCDISLTTISYVIMYYFADNSFFSKAKKLVIKRFSGVYLISRALMTIL